MLARSHRQAGVKHWYDVVSIIVRLIRRPKGMRNAPRGGDPFPSGPYPVFPRDAYQTGGDYPYPVDRRGLARTQADLPAVPLARPYVKQTLNGWE